MDPAKVSAVRRFNRTVTQRLGALNDRFLSRKRPLGEARLLWEIAEGGRDVRSLRGQLELDSGYLSRLLRSLEAAGLVTLGRGTTDKRVRTVRLTRSGRAERAVLDKRSDELAGSFLEPLSAPQRDRLVAAMGEVERLLTASSIRIGPVDPDRPAARHCLREYFAELDHRFERGFDPARSISADAAELRPPQGLLLVAWLRSESVGCGALKFHGDAPTEIKRMWVAETARGLGVGRRLLAALEARAAEHAAGGGLVQLETNKSLTEAMRLYRSAGYQEVEPFNDEPYAHHWFRKRLAALTSPRAPVAGRRRG